MSYNAVIQLASVAICTSVSCQTVIMYKYTQINVAKKFNCNDCTKHCASTKCIKLFRPTTNRAAKQKVTDWHRRENILRSSWFVSDFTRNGRLNFYTKLWRTTAWINKQNFCLSLTYQAEPCNRMHFSCLPHQSIHLSLSTAIVPDNKEKLT